ncbi:hypothetical protein ABT346_24955 [Micromonospora peucetia]|uniref:hypothetical protein n=1 Tax=Micromonospora peucetia TaxID=47871 RepID=UPI0033178E6C
MDSSQIVAQLVERTRDTPYAVTSLPGGARIGLDVADLRWSTLFHRSGLTIEHAVVLRFDDAKRSYTWHQESRRMSYRFGFDGQVIGASFRKDVFKGTQLTLQRGVVAGRHDDGSLVRGYRFDSRELTGLVDSVLVPSGWRRAMDRYTKIGLIAAIAGGGIAVLTMIGLGVAFLVAG